MNKNVEPSLTMEKIDEAQSLGKTGSDFPKVAKEMKKIGVRSYLFNAITGSRVYESYTGYKLEGFEQKEKIKGSADVSKGKLQQALKSHQSGETLFPTFRKQAIDSGVNFWKADFERMVVEYFDAKNNLILSEPIPK